MEPLQYGTMCWYCTYRMYEYRYVQCCNIDKSYPELLHHLQCCSMLFTVHLYIFVKLVQFYFHSTALFCQKTSRNIIVTVNTIYILCQHSPSLLELGLTRQSAFFKYNGTLHVVLYLLYFYMTLVKNKILLLLCAYTLSS
jgi:hypothetical protein